jgi:hypothetical protein
LRARPDYYHAAEDRARQNVPAAASIALKAAPDGGNGLLV